MISMNVDELIDIVIDAIEKSKHKVINIKDVNKILQKHLGNSYTEEISNDVKNKLINHNKLDFFKEGNYYHQDKCYYCVGSWLCKKGLYENPILAKKQIGLESYEE